MWVVIICLECIPFSPRCAWGSKSRPQNGWPKKHIFSWFMFVQTDLLPSHKSEVGGGVGWGMFIRHQL